MKQKLSSRILIVLISVVMLITALPLNSLTAFADEPETGGAGGGHAGGGTVIAGDHPFVPLSGEGVRMYIIDTENNNSPVPFKFGGKTYWAIDAWESPTAVSNSYVGGGGVIGKVYYDTGLRAWGKNLNQSGLLQIKYSDIGFGGFLNSDFVVSGETFYDWMTGSSGNKINGTAVPMQTWLMYSLFANKNISTLKTLMSDKYYLVVEPLGNFPVYGCYTCSSGEFSNLGETYYYTIRGSWLDYIKSLYTWQSNSEGGWQAIKAKQHYGNGFRIEDNRNKFDTATEQALYAKALEKMLNDTGFSIPSTDIRTHVNGAYVSKPSHILEYTKGGTTGAGWGVQVYWCSTDIKFDEPIDTYDILTTPSPSTPAKCEPPSEDNETDGDKTILKLYVDLYQDGATYNTTNKTSTYYTQAIDKGSYIRKDCASDIIISDESDLNGGYKIKAWYTSKSDTSSNSYSGKSMLKTTNSISDTSTDYKVGRVAFALNGYNALNGLVANGSKSYVAKAGGSLKGTTGAKVSTFTRTATNKKTRKTSQDNVHISLADDEKTLVVLYVREHGWFDSSEWSDGGGSGTSKDPYAKLKVVKCYGLVNPITYEVTEATDKLRKAGDTKSRNVRIKGSDGAYRLAEYVYCASGSSDWGSMTAAKWGNPSGATSPDDAFYIKGFIDGFGKNGQYGSGRYSSQYTWSETAFTQGGTNTTSTIVGDMTYIGTYGTGRLRRA